MDCILLAYVQLINWMQGPVGQVVSLNKDRFFFLMRVTRRLYIKNSNDQVSIADLTEEFYSVYVEKKA